MVDLLTVEFALEVLRAVLVPQTNSKLLAVKSGAPKDGDDAAIAKAFVCSILIEVEPALLRHKENRNLVWQASS